MRSVGRLTVVTSPLGLARLLWFCGEDELWEQALASSPEVVADIGTLAGNRAMNSAEVDAIWRDRPRDGYLLIAAIQVLDGAPRPAKRGRRRPSKGMPAVLVATEAQHWADPALPAVADVVHQRRRDGKAN